MKKLLVTFATGFVSLFSFAQKIDKIINPTEVERIERILSADDMQGRMSETHAGIASSTNTSPRFPSRFVRSPRRPTPLLTKPSSALRMVIFESRWR